MDSSGFRNIVCRICLDENVAFDWNNTLIEHDDVTYKDCYYKYTQLQQLGNDPLSSMLCKSCSNSLEDVHALILKALDSYNFLLEVNCAKMDLEDSNIVDDEVNCSSTDFETVLVDKAGPDSVMLEHFQYENSEDELDKFDDMQFQEIIEEEEDQGDFEKNQLIERNNVKEDNWKVYETARRKSKRIISRKRRYGEEAEQGKEYYSRNKGSQVREKEKNYDSFDEISVKSEGKNIDTEEVGYVEILENEDEHEEYETNRAEFNITGEVGPKVNKRKRKESKSATKNKRSLEKDDDSNSEWNFEDSQKLELELKTNDSKTKKSSVTKTRRTKTKNGSLLNSQNTPSMCSYCSKILHNKYALQKHEKTHVARERKAPCPICGVKFLEESYVKIHMQIHNQDRIKKHQCEFCDKAFFEKGSLNVHRRIHLGTMIPCTICSKEFFRQVDLEIHMNSHSAAVKNTGERKKRSRYWVRCKYCNKDIMSTSFKYHTAVHLNEPQMKCSICDREFFRRDSCTDHLKTIHKIPTEEYSNFIILYNKNRLSHLYLEQTTELKK